MVIKLLVSHLFNENSRQTYIPVAYITAAKMAKVNITDVMVLDNPSPFRNPFQFEITFECLENLPEDLEWKIVYVGSAESEDFDQVLDSVLVGPVPDGKHKFVFQADPPDTSKIPLQDAVGVTVVLLTCSFRRKEFIRVGYYVNNEYMDPELKENPPAIPDYTKLQRNILATRPRVTKFKIEWDNNSQAATEGNNIDCENIPPETSSDNMLLVAASNEASCSGFMNGVMKPVNNGNVFQDSNSMNMEVGS